MSGMRAFRVWRGGLSGRYFAGMAIEEADGRWRITGKRHDVTDDIERIIAEMIAPAGSAVSSTEARR